MALFLHLNHCTTLDFLSWPVGFLSSQILLNYHLPFFITSSEFELSLESQPGLSHNTHTCIPINCLENADFLKRWCYSSNLL